MLLCFLVFCFLMAASALPFIFLLTLSVTHFDEGHLGVKIVLLREAWLISVDTWLNGGSNASKRDRSVSITYEILGTDVSFSGEDFQNIGIFIVVRSSVFVKSSAHKTHLARDAYNAYSRRASGCQGLFIQ